MERLTEIVEEVYSKGGIRFYCWFNYCLWILCVVTVLMYGDIFAE